MMKIVTSKQMAEIESSAYKDGFKEEDFMEAAGKGIAESLDNYIKNHCLERKITFVCGSGNNGGDAYTAAYHLLKHGYEIIVYQFGTFEKCNRLCQIHCNQLRDRGLVINFFDSASKLELSHGKIIVDALFGTGLNRPLEEPYISIIKKINKSNHPIISIDIPSGLDGNSGLCLGEAIQANHTLFLGLPKIGFFICDGWNHIGKLEYIDFGLPSSAVKSFEATITMFQIKDLNKIFPRMLSNRHKYQAGCVYGLAGSPGMAGAANLSTSASLKGGAGIVKLLYPKGMEAELSGSLYELVKIAYENSDHQFVIECINKANSVFIGPGLGITPETKELMKTVLNHITVPIVIDADALNIIAEENLPFPKNCIITPHLGEFLRLLKITTKQIVNNEFLLVCQEFVEKHKIVLILKGGPSFIFCPGEPAVIVPYGDPGMATAGSGDVLTGLTASLLAQGLSLRNAAIAAVFLHAYSGECAAKAKTSYCMTAGDIIGHFHCAFSLLKNLH